MATKRKAYDWEAIEREFRAGQLSINEIARQYGCSDTAIRKKAKANGWTRDLTKDVNRRIKDNLVRDEVRTTNAKEDAEIVEAAALRGAEVVRAHRRDIRTGAELSQALLSELLTTTTHVGDLEEMITDETEEDKDQRRRNVMMKAISLPGRAGTLRDISNAMKNFVGLERQAFNLDDVGGEKKPSDLSDEQLDAKIHRLIDELKG